MYITCSREHIKHVQRLLEDDGVEYLEGCATCTPETHNNRNMKSLSGGVPTSTLHASLLQQCIYIYIYIIIYIVCARHYIQGMIEVTLGAKLATISPRNVALISGPQTPCFRV